MIAASSIELAGYDDPGQMRKVARLTATLASTVAANGWAGLPAPIPSGSLGGFDGILLAVFRAALLLCM